MANHHRGRSRGRCSRGRGSIVLMDNKQSTNDDDRN